MQPETPADASGLAVLPQGNLSLAAVASDSVSDLLDAAAGMTRMIASIEAVRARIIDMAIRASVDSVSDASAVRTRDLRLRSLRAELACALRIPERTAERMLYASEVLARNLPGTLASLDEGRISYRHAEALVDETTTLESSAVAELEAAALPHAEQLTVAKFRKKLRMLREAIEPGSAVDRHHEAVKQREVLFEPARDGMAWLSAYLPAADALAAFNRITGLAESLGDGAGGGVGGGVGGSARNSAGNSAQRTLAQRRADVLVDLLHSGEPSEGPRGVRPTVHVTVPVMALLGRELAKDLGVMTPPATLDGYGPIDDETARMLAAAAPSFSRLLTHPESGVVLSVGRDSYVVPADLRRWVRLRDGTCRFPGCSQPADRCDLDHTRDWALGGTTDFDNLAHLCRGHHTLKHKTEWRVSNDGATLRWTSPSGRIYVTQPQFHLRT
ncbi:HNH endonuclease [Salinibacterium sp. SYSU T00001]|uniref:HNH endonuclease signature motif containing protein n=1 Tax=Homoserinimonas sedimenticola TaxID=2986805 RepID=UPI0022359FE6|nr:HNH endonuclease signature motif containing protein [Salinibacterium sedimenticola]MCW4385134.1 HNH endonuclease [Salinibacterium sedimenticola]